MSMTEIIIIIILIAITIGIVTLVYDKIKYHKYYNSTLVVLHLNNDYVRNILKGNGLTLCPCAYNNDNPLLCTNGNVICSFSEKSTHLLANAKKKHKRIIDCNIDIKQFIYEIQKIQNP